MTTCPAYRVRLFLSVDLVGSTAFKAKDGDETDADGLYPKWLNRTKIFYRDFPRLLLGNCQDQKRAIHKVKDEDLPIPQVWKTVGDEIIFCVTINSLEHLAVCYNGFLKALFHYGDDLKVVQPQLDVKGCAWVAVFPFPNVTIVSASRLIRDKGPDVAGGPGGEDQEKHADQVPGDFDFLGKNIDTGFRISKYAQAHQMAVSIELAWLLTTARQHQLISVDFTYHGREPLKGVINNHPYPVVTVETERDHAKRRLQELERSVGFGAFANHIALEGYLREFMKNHQIDTPIVALHGQQVADTQYPAGYIKFRREWDLRIVEDERRDNRIFESEESQVEVSADTNEEIDDINQYIDEILGDLEE